MARQLLGESIREAIDWTQDKLRSTRPIAERVLFSLLNERKAQETEAGFMLLEVDEEDMMKRSRQRHTNHRPRFRFHNKRQGLTERHAMMKQHQGTNYSEEAGDMEAADLVKKKPQSRKDGWFL